VTDLDVGEPHIANLCAVPARNPPLDLTAGPHLVTLCNLCSRCVTATGPRPGAHCRRSGAPPDGWQSLLYRTWTENMRSGLPGRSGASRC